jgi:formiminotetrahydrofolate cyclodeaminase
MQNVYELKFGDFIQIAASKSHTPEGVNVSAVVATLGASMVAMVAEAAMPSCMLSVGINLPSIKDQDFVKDALDERARRFTNAEELIVQAMAGLKEKVG